MKKGDTIGTFTVTVGGLYRFKTTATNSIGTSQFSFELVSALAGLPEIPSTPTFDLGLSSRFQNVLQWTEGISLDIEVTGYKLYSDNGLPGNMFLIYDGSQNTQIMTYYHTGLIPGTIYNYQLEVLNFNGASAPSALATRMACDAPSIFNNL